MSQSKKRKLASESAAKATVDDIESAPGFSKAETAQIQTALLDWYDRNHRALPWRRNPHSLAPSADDAAHQALLKVPQQQMIYRVWISEIMCQQTQVARAAGYFEKWLLKWPDVQSLAAATLDEVNDLWAGLGYYRRAKYLHSGAQHVVDKLGGKFPTTSKQLQKIPGIGAYTGAAIASIACGEQAAVVDANVVRVLARLLKIGDDPSSKAATLRFAAEAAALLSPDRPGDFNQESLSCLFLTKQNLAATLQFAAQAAALLSLHRPATSTRRDFTKAAMMEHGAVTCTQAPKCSECAVRGHCAVYADVLRHTEGGGAPADAPPVTQYPTKVQKAKRHEQRVAVCVVRAASGGGGGGGHNYLLVKRAEKGLLAGLWEFPSVMLENSPAARGVRRSKINDYLRETLELFPDQMVARRELGSVSHTFSHIAMTLDVEMMSVEWSGDDGPSVPADEPGKGLRWLSKAQLAREGLSSVMRKVAALIDKPQPPADAGQQKLSFGKRK